MKALDTQVVGGHYKDLPIQPVEFAMANNLDYCQANAIKYIVRFREKNGIEDLNKAIHYIELLKEFHEKQSKPDLIPTEIDIRTVDSQSFKEFLKTQSTIGEGNPTL